MNDSVISSQMRSISRVIDLHFFSLKPWGRREAFACGFSWCVETQQERDQPSRRRDGKVPVHRQLLDSFLRFPTVNFDEFATASSPWNKYALNCWLLPIAHWMIPPVFFDYHPIHDGNPYPPVGWDRWRTSAETSLPGTICFSGYAACPRTETNTWPMWISNFTHDDFTGSPVFVHLNSVGLLE